MLDSTRVFYGVTQDWSCVEFIEEDTKSLKSNNDLKKYRYVIERHQVRISRSGITPYLGTKIYNSNLIPTSIEHEGAKILSISNEVWMNLGDFDRDEVAIYWPSREGKYHDPHLFLYIDKMKWQILQQPSSFKICLVEFEDCFGYKQLVSTAIFSEIEIGHLLKRLFLLSEMKSYSAFKLTVLLRQISTFTDMDKAEKDRAKLLFTSAIEPEYKKCKQYHPNVFHDFDDLDEWYEEIHSSLFD